MKTASNGAPIGIVIRSHGSRADVSTTRHGACASCAEASACGVAEAESCPETVTVRNPVGARPGDTVELGLPPHGVACLSALVWIVPLTGLVIGAALGTWLAGSAAADAGARAGTAASDLPALLGAVAGTTAAFAVLRRIDRRSSGDPRITPRIARVLARGGSR